MDNFSGSNKKISGEFKDSQAGPGRFVCHSLGSLAEKVRSLKFKKETNAGAKGYWKGITATEGIKYTIHVGITSSDSKTDKSQSTEALKKSAQNGWHVNASVEGGANFGFASASVKVEGGASGSTTNDNSSEEQVAQEIANVSGMD